MEFCYENTKYITKIPKNIYWKSRKIKYNVVDYNLFPNYKKYNFS